MPTIAEMFASMEKGMATQQEATTPSNFVFPVRSGTKNLKTNFNTSGNFAQNKTKVARNPRPIFGMEENTPTDTKVATSHPLHDALASKGVVNIQRMPKIANTTTRPVMEYGVYKVYGMERMGGAGVRYMAGTVEKLEEKKLIKLSDLDNPFGTRKNAEKIKGDR